VPLIVAIGRVFSEPPSPAILMRLPFFKMLSSESYQIFQESLALTFLLDCAHSPKLPVRYLMRLAGNPDAPF
jgi:hypothetical protein